MDVSQSHSFTISQRVFSTPAFEKCKPLRMIEMPRANVSSLEHFGAISMLNWRKLARFAHHRNREAVEHSPE
jgi:hypothetical protein